MEKEMSTAWNMVSEVELVYKTKIKASLRPKIVRSKDAYEVLMSHWDENKIEMAEEFKVLLLNRGNKVLCIYEMSTGGITGTVADPRLIFAAALKRCATAIVLAHNHPGGDPKPSETDKALTQKIKEAGKLLDIHVMDHIIVTPESYFSFADEGLL
jgi:DNA repair protein RadC